MPTKTTHTYVYHATPRKTSRTTKSIPIPNTRLRLVTQATRKDGLHWQQTHVARPGNAMSLVAAGGVDWHRSSSDGTRWVPVSFSPFAPFSPHPLLCRPVLRLLDVFRLLALLERVWVLSMQEVWALIVIRQRSSLKTNEFDGALLSGVADDGHLGVCLVSILSRDGVSSDLLWRGAQSAPNAVCRVSG